MKQFGPPLLRGGLPYAPKRVLRTSKLAYAYLVAVVFLSCTARFQPVLGAVHLRPDYLLVAVGYGFLALAGRLPRLRDVPGGRLLACWLVVNLLSSCVTALDVAASLESLMLLVGGVMTLVTVCYVARRIGPGGFRMYLDVWFVAIAVGVFGTVGDVLAGTNYVSNNYEDVVAYRRTVGTFFEPNFYGISAMMLAIICFDEWLNSPSHRIVPWRLVVCVIGVVISGTRSAQLCLVLGMLIVLGARIRSSRLAFSIAPLGAAAATLIVVFILGGVITTSYTDRLIAPLLEGGSSSSLSGRVAQAEIALAEFPEEPVFGHGTNSYGQFNPTFASSGNAVYGRLGSYIGILPLIVLYDTGCVGAILVLGWLIIWHKAAFVSGRRPSFHPLLWSATLAAALMFLAFFATSGLFVSFGWVHMGMTTAMLTESGIRKGGIHDMPTGRDGRKELG